MAWGSRLCLEDACGCSPGECGKHVASRRKTHRFFHRILGHGDHCSLSRATYPLGGFQTVTLLEHQGGLHSLKGEVVSWRLLFTWCFRTALCGIQTGGRAWNSSLQKVIETGSPGSSPGTCLCALLTFDPLERLRFIGGKEGEEETSALLRIK